MGGGVAIRARVFAGFARGEEEAEGGEAGDYDCCTGTVEVSAVSVGECRAEEGGEWSGAIPIEASIIAQTASQLGLGCFECEFDRICATRMIEVQRQMMPTPKMAIMLSFRMVLSYRFQRIRIGKTSTE